MNIFFLFLTLYTVKESNIQKDLLRTAIELNNRDMDFPEKKITFEKQSLFVIFYRTYILIFRIKPIILLLIFYD